MLVAERILKQLVLDGKISFNESDLKGVKSAQKRLLLYSLGAYKDIMIDKQLLHIFGIRNIKVCINSNIPLNQDSIIEFLTKDALSNLKSISGVNNISINRDYAYVIRYEIQALLTWKNINRGKDLFIPGFGGFDIEKTYARLVAINKSDNWTLSEDIIQADYVTLAGYFPTVSSSSELQSLRKIKNYFPDILEWLSRNKTFPMERLDELIDLSILNGFSPKRSLDKMLSICNDLNTRNLRLSYMDKEPFNYPKYITNNKYIRDNYAIPENGIELKKAGRAFKNCAGSYVRKILRKDTYIIYNDISMAEIKNNQVIQHYGKSRLPLPDKVVYDLANSLV